MEEKRQIWGNFDEKISPQKHLGLCFIQFAIHYLLDTNGLTMA